MMDKKQYFKQRQDMMYYKSLLTEIVWFYRYGDNESEFQFKDNGTGLPFDVTKQSDVTVTNPVGFRETYHVWRSTNLLTMSNLTVLIASV